jgi:hypothetical protein
MGWESIGTARGVEKDGELCTLAVHGGHEAIASFVAEGGGVDVVPLGSPHPALLRKYHGDRFARHEHGLRHGLSRMPCHERGAPGVTIAFSVLL